MKSIILCLVFLLPIGMAVHAGAGEGVEELTNSNSPAGLILLVLIGVVVASGGGMFATRNDNSLDIESDDADKNAGF